MLLTLKEEAECRAKYKIVKIDIVKGYDNLIIAHITGLSIEELRKEVKK